MTILWILRFVIMNFMLCKNKSVTFLFLLISLTSVLSAQQSYSDISKSSKSVIFQDSFDNNSNNWLLDNSWIKGEVMGGSYDIRCKNFQKSTGLTYKTIAIDQLKDYEIEASIKAVKGTGGVVFGMNSKYDHYRVELADNKIFIVKNTPSKGKNQELYSGSVNQSIKQGSFNKITIRSFKGVFYVFLNEYFIGKFSTIKPDGDQIGFNVGLNSEISVDYLNINYLEKQVTIPLANRDLTRKDSVVSPKPANNISVSGERAKNPTDNQGDPELSWTSPSAASTNWDQYSASVKAVIKSPSDLTSVIVYVNGSPKGQADWKLIPGQSGSYRIEKTINLDPGENVVYYTATNSVGSKKSDERIFIIPEASKPVISWNMPEVTNVGVDNERFIIEVCIKSPSGLKSVKVYVNGENMGGDNVFKSSDADNNCNIKWQYPVILKEDLDNSIVVYAENAAGTTPSESRTIRYSRSITEKRIALVIGNSNYGAKTPLKNPLQDANLMEATLEGLGFVVDKRTDLGLKEMNTAVREFSQKMKDCNVALFYYAGHGVQVDGKNYLIPVDAKLATKDDCEWEAFAVEDLLQQFEKNPKNVNIAILDACRSNPFTGWVRGEQAGFQPISKTNGMFISFATAPGSTAADGSTGNGLFTEELVKQMNVHQPISSVFLNTRVNVWDKSKQTQRPQEWNDLNGEFYFKK